MGLVGCFMNDLERFHDRVVPTFGLQCGGIGVKPADEILPGRKDGEPPSGQTDVGKVEGVCHRRAVERVEGIDEGAYGIWSSGT